MQKSIVGIFVLGLMASCTTTQKQEAAAFEQNAVAAVRSGALMLHGALQAVRDNQATIDEALAIGKTLVPPGSKLDKLDDEAKAAVAVIQTSSDKELLQAATQVLIAHTVPK